MITSDERTVAQVFYPQGIHSFAEADKREEADARFIVTACNNFEEIYGALKLMTALVRLKYDNLDKAVWENIREAEALLARIEGEK
jgi:hypothetical protein